MIPPRNFLWIDLFSKKNEVEVTVLSVLKANQLFCRLTRKELALVANLVHIRNYEAGEAVFSQAEKGLGMYIIVKGSIEIRIHEHGKPGEEIAVAELGPGSFFGEHALIDPESKRTASAYSRGPTVLAGFFKPDLMEIMERKPETGVKILFQLAKVLGKRLSETTEALTQATQQLPEIKKAA